jgi:hypothetical protein
MLSTFFCTLKRMKVKNKILIGVLLTFSVLLQSCFDVVEQITLNNNGSGTYTVTLNLSKSKTKLNSIAKMKTVNGYEVPSKDEIKTKIDQVVAVVAKTAGITNAKSKVDLTNYIVTIDCNFANITNINTALKNVTKMDGGKEAKELDNAYSYNAATKTFVRSNKVNFKEMYKKVNAADKEVFTGAGFTSIIKFEGTVASSSNKTAVTSPSKKAIMLKANALDIISGKTSIENTIKLN